MKVEIPTQCPSCKSKLTRVNNQLFCYNDSCSGIAAKVVLGYIKKVKILGLGEKTVEKLSIVDIHDIYTLTKEEVVEAIGEKLGYKLLDNIDGSRIMTIGTFMSAFSIPLAGSTIAGKISSEAVDDITYESLREDGIGDKAASNIYKWVLETYPKYVDLPIKLLPNKSVVKVENPTFVVCITGKLSGYTKATLTNELTNLGVKVVGSITKATTHLICDVQKGSSKEIKASSLNIPIVSLIEFKEILNNVKK